MNPFNYQKNFILFIAILFSLNSTAQFAHGLKNGVSMERYCSKCQQAIANMPKEVMFGLLTQSNGDVYFSINNIEWFNKIFPNPSFGVSADIVSKTRYACNIKRNYGNDFIRGTLLEPVYKPDLLKANEDITPGTMFVKIGRVPQNLIGKEIEANLVIVNGDLICYYLHLVNIPRNSLDLLPMGLFTDSLINTSAKNDYGESMFFTYSKTLQFEIPFAKSKTTYNEQDLKPVYDSLELNNYDIKKIEIRAYSSVEGAQKINEQLMADRAQSIVAALKKYQPLLSRTKIITAENWIEFFRDVANTRYPELAKLSKFEVKKQLSDKVISENLEPILAKERKASITLFIEKKATHKYGGGSVIDSFNAAINRKDVETARIIERELLEDIADNKQPLDYINKLEIPSERIFSLLLNDREVYKLLLKVTSEYQALQNFLELQKIDPDNGKINYNICALKFFVWRAGEDSSISNTLLAEIGKLSKQGIDSSLVKRMKINYHILKCEEYNASFKYNEKDASLDFIKDNYESLPLTDDDIYSLAKYFAYYSRFDWAEEIIEPRIDKVDVSEDLVFYYINLLFFQPGQFDESGFQSALLNAINLNRERYCNFFLPNDKGGASMQLLEYETLKQKYCESCGK